MTDTTRRQFFKRGVQAAGVTLLTTGLPGSSKNTPKPKPKPKKVAPVFAFRKFLKFINKGNYDGAKRFLKKAMEAETEVERSIKKSISKRGIFEKIKSKVKKVTSKVKGRKIYGGGGGMAYIIKETRRRLLKGIPGHDKIQH